MVRGRRPSTGWPRIWRRLGYRPSPNQLAAHADEARIKLVAGGERGGKSFWTAKEIERHEPVHGSLYWIVGPTYELARPEFLYLLEDYGRMNYIAERPSVPAYGRCVLRTIWGAEYATVSSDDALKLAGRAPNGIAMTEAAQQSYAVYLRCRGRIAEARGWLILSGTFESSLGWYAQFFKRWQADNPEDARSFSLPTWSNLAVFPGGRDDPEIKALEATYPADLFMERFGAVPSAPATLVFKEFQFSTHVSDQVRYDPALPVEIAVDPGYAGAYAVLAIQRKDGVYGDIIHVIDEVYRRGMVAEEVIALCMAKAWWPKVTGGVMDVAGEQHQGMPSHSQVWRHRAKVFLRSNRVGVRQGIHRLHTFLKDPATGQPRVLFAASLAGGVDGLGNPRGILAEFGLYRYRELNEGQPVREEPVDRDNHSLKALSYWLYDRFGPVEREEPKSPVVHDRGGFR